MRVYSSTQIFGRHICEILSPNHPLHFLRFSCTLVAYPPRPMPNDRISGGNQQTVERTILVVDDEEFVIEAVRETLLDCPFRLIATTDPHHALTILQGSEPVDLLVTDLFMPSMDGARLLKEGRRFRPALKAILLTGAASHDEHRRWSRRGE